MTKLGIIYAKPTLRCCGPATAERNPRGGQHYLDNGGPSLTALWPPSRRVRRTKLFGRGHYRTDGHFVECLMWRAAAVIKIWRCSSSSAGAPQNPGAAYHDGEG